MQAQRQQHERQQYVQLKANILQGKQSSHKIQVPNGSYCLEQRATGTAPACYVQDYNVFTDKALYTHFMTQGLPRTSSYGCCGMEERESVCEPTSLLEESDSEVEWSTETGGSCCASACSCCSCWMMKCCYCSPSSRWWRIAELAASVVTPPQ